MDWQQKPPSQRGALSAADFPFINMRLNGHKPTHPAFIYSILYMLYIVYVVVYPLLAVGYRLVDWLEENMKISKWTQGSTCCSAVRSIDAQLARGGAPAWRWSLTNWRFAGLSSGHSA